MLFYCLFDLLDYYRKEKKQSEEEFFRFFLKKGIRKTELLFFKNNCSIDSASKIMPYISDYCGLSELEIYLSLGIIPEKYKGSFFKNITQISNLLYPELHEEKHPHIKPFFTSYLGTLYNEDCINVLKIQPSESIDLIFADPPFNLNKEYDIGVNDNLSMSQYLSWCYQWIDECIRVLKPGGSLYIYNIPRWTTYYAQYLNQRITMRSIIGINMRAGMPLAGRLYPAHYSLLYYIKGDKPNCYNNQRIPLETCPHCGGEFHDYGGYKNKMNPLGINLSDVWSDIYPVRHKKDKNRTFNELSVKMLERIISMSSNPQDLVLDPFGGSGTTYIVAELLERRWIGSEIGNCSIIQDRFANIDKDRSILEKIQTEKNVLFTEKVKKLRKKNKYWVSEDFV